MLSEDYDVGLAGRYGWINRALPGNALGSLAQRRPIFPRPAKSWSNDVSIRFALAPAEDFRGDSDVFIDAAREPESQKRS